MTTASSCLMTLLLAAAPLADAWQREYTTDEARAPHVLALWQFSAGRELDDSSAQGHTLTLAGAETIAEGKFGGGLRCFPGWPVNDQKHAAIAASHPDLSPQGPFTVDLWIQPADDLPPQGNAHLLCKKYVSHQDYQLLLTPLEGQTRRLQLSLGFGADSEVFLSDAVDWPAGVWQHIAVTYDGAGTVQFFRNGNTLGTRTAAGRAAIAAGTLPLTIGDRTGSLYGGFAGVLDQVRLSEGVREFSPVRLELTSDRSTYVRMEPAPLLQVRMTNLQPDPLVDAVVTISGIGSPQQVNVPPLDSGATHVLDVKLDTNLRPDVYELKARVDIPGPLASHRELTRRMTLVHRPLPHRMPVMMWGIGSPAEFQRELARLKELGFTQCLGFGPDYDAIWKAGAPLATADVQSSKSAQQVREMLDLALANDFGIAATLYAGYYLKQKPELARVDREGKPYARHDVNASLPGLAPFCENVGATVGQVYGDHPAFVAALINSEVRDDAEISFSAHDRQAYRQHSGQDIPDEVTTKYGLDWTRLPDFPRDRVIPDDDPRRRFLYWFWTEGDGWNRLHSALHHGLISAREASGAPANDFYTWFDPAIRAASVPGSGGQVDVLSQWTYTEPSPLRLAYFTDELSAMASLAPQPQRIMKMTQLFWYRSTSAPLGTGTDYVASPFDDHDPDAAYISIAPMHLRGAFWTMLSRPVSGLMYHGWSSLVPTDGTHAYKYTQPDLQTEFRRLHREVLEPLGPTLLQVGCRRSDVAYLDSFTSQMFARRGSYGYSHDEAYLTLLHAQLQPEVIFEDTIFRHGLDGYRIVVLADCDVLPASVATRLQQFQQQGGLIIGDPQLAPAIQADVVIPKFTRSKNAAEDKACLLRHAAELREALDARYERYVETTNPELIAHVRRAGTSDYVFVINDQREAGNYVGQHGLVQEVGLPSSGEVRIRVADERRPAESADAPSERGPYVYDLTEHELVNGERREDQLRWPVTLEPCDGKVYLVTDRAIDALNVQLPEQALLGGACACTITITDADARPIDAVIPVLVEITDPHGRPAEFSGYYGAATGQLTLTLDLATNDAPGTWTVRVAELASGLKTTRFVRVKVP